MSRRHFAAILALVLGGYGVHWFYLRRPGRGIVYILLAFTGASIVLGVIDAVRFLWIGEPEFERRYIAGRAALYGAQSRHSRNHRLYSVWSPISDASDWNDVDRLRREWQVERYDPHYGTHVRASAGWHHGDFDHPIINPATGLAMMGGIGGLDSSGHSFGTGAGLDDLHHWHRNDDAFGRAGDDIHSSGGDSHFNAWDH